MTKRVVLGLALGAGLIAVLAVLYVYYPGGPQMEPGKPEAPGEMQYRTAPEFTGKPAAPDTGPSLAREPQPAHLAEATPPPAGIPAPEVKPPAAQETPEPPSKPEEHYGLLVRRYRTYKQASKMMEKLQKEGTPAFIRHDGRQRKPYAVWAGPYTSQKEAEAAATSLKKKKLKVSLKLEKLQIPVPK